MSWSAGSRWTRRRSRSPPSRRNTPGRAARRGNRDLCAGLRRHPSYLSAHVTLGRAWASLGRIAEARAEFERVLRLAPENLAAIRGLAEIHGLAESESAAENQSSLALPISIPHHTLSVPPALVGLEHFLGAISRARGADSGPVSLGAR